MEEGGGGGTREEEEIEKKCHSNYNSMQFNNRSITKPHFCKISFFGLPGRTTEKDLARVLMTCISQGQSHPEEVHTQSLLPMMVGRRKGLRHKRNPCDLIYCPSKGIGFP